MGTSGGNPVRSVVGSESAKAANAENPGLLNLENTLPVSYLHDAAPETGCALKIADGIWTLRLPIPLSMDHINVYLIEGDDGWTLVDTGTNTDDCRQALVSALEQPPFADKPVVQVIVTHFHPDHVGLAGYFTSGKHRDYRASLLTSRTCWQTSQLLISDDSPVPHDAQLAFVEKFGMNGMDLESFKRRKPGSYAQNVLPLAASYVRLREGDELVLGSRTWQVLVGHGHADDHIVLWSNDNIAIVGDQILPAISPNLSVHYTEPEANCVGDWIESCRKFGVTFNDKTICLPGHNRPFTGAPRRCQQLVENCNQVVLRIQKALVKPRTGMELMPDIYRRELKPAERNALIGETVAYLNYLLNAGLVKRRLNRRGNYLWRIIK